MNDTKTTPQALWKAQVLEYLHNCLIGISHLACSQENCPLVYNWNELETKLSKKGKCVFYKITANHWIVVDLIKYETNDLGTYENIEIQFKSGKVMKTKPKNLEPVKETTIKESGYNPKKGKETEEIFLKEEEIILFFNNQAHTANLKDAETIYLNNIWEIKEKIRWDQDKSKKKVFLHTENEPSTETETTKIAAAEKDYLFYISDPSITNAIKKMEVYSPGTGTQERQQLHQDLKEEFSELRRVYGIRHLTSKKEDRQNNPEIELNESQFIALERDKKRERAKAIKDFEQKGGCNGEHILSYGTAPEQREEKVLEEAATSHQAEELEEIKKEAKELEKMKREPKEAKEFNCEPKEQEIYERKH